MGLATDAGRHATAPTGVKTRSHRFWVVYSFELEFFPKLSKAAFQFL